MHQTPVEAVKILVVGPIESGKSAIADFLSQHKETLSQYRPTKALRILSFERDGLNFIKNTSDQQMIGNSKALIELWDVSGNTNYSNCWPAISQDVDGILFVMDPNSKNENEMDYWHNQFAQSIKDSCCMLFIHYKTQIRGKRPKLCMYYLQIF